MRLATFTPDTELVLLGKTYDVTSWNPDEDTLTLASADGEKRELTLTVLLEHYRQGNARPAQKARRSKSVVDARAAARARVQRDVLSLKVDDKTLAEGEFRAKVIKWVEEKNVPLVDRHSWPQHQAEFRKDFDLKPDAWVPGMSTVKRWRTSFYAAHHDPARMIPRYDLRGGRGTRRLLPEVEDLIQFHIDNFFLTSERMSMRQVHEIIIGQIEVQNKSRSSQNKLKCPGYSTFIRRVQACDAYEAYAARYGKGAAEYRFRTATRGHMNRLGFMEQWQMDHAVLNVIVIDPETGLPLGRPRLTIIIEASTRMCMSFTIGLDGMSAIATLECLRRAILPKSRAELEAMGVRGNWPAFGLPLVLSLDNGSDYHSRALRQALFELGVEVQYCPRKKAWFKGGVERAIQTFNRQGVGYLPGSVVTPNLKAALGLDQDSKIDPAKLAIVDLKDLTEILHRWLIDDYHNHAMGSLKHASPSQAWEKLATPDRLQVPEDIERLALYCTLPVKRTISTTGLQLCNVKTFNSPELQTARQLCGDTGTEVNVRYSPRRMDRLWFEMPGSGDWIEVLNSDSDTNDLSARELQLVIAHQKRVNADGDRKITIAEARTEMVEWARQLRTAKTMAKRKLVYQLLGLTLEDEGDSDQEDQLPDNPEGLEAARARARPRKPKGGDAASPAPSTPHPPVSPTPSAQAAEVTAAAEFDSAPDF